MEHNYIQNNISLGETAQMKRLIITLCLLTTFSTQCGKGGKNKRQVASNRLQMERFIREQIEMHGDDNIKAIILATKKKFGGDVANKVRAVASEEYKIKGK